MLVDFETTALKDCRAFEQKQQTEMRQLQQAQRRETGRLRLIDGRNAASEKQVTMQHLHAIESRVLSDVTAHLVTPKLLAPQKKEETAAATPSTFLPSSSPARRISSDPAIVSGRQSRFGVICVLLMNAFLVLLHIKDGAAGRWGRQWQGLPQAA